MLKVVRQEQRGATLVEFALISFTLFFIIGFITDIGITLHRYAVLTYATTREARKLAIEMANWNGLGCAAVTNRVNEVLTPHFMSEQFGVGGDYTFTAEIIPAVTADLPPFITVPAKLRITGEASIACGFCLSELPWLRIGSSVDAIIDNSEPGFVNKCCGEQCDCEAYNCD